MKNWIFSILMVALCLSCGQQSGGNASVANEAVDLSAYTSEQLDGVAGEYVVKRDANGAILEEGFMNGAQKTGVWTTYNVEKGTVKMITPYLDGQLNGRLLEFDDKNRIVAQRGYKNGQLHGFAATYKFSNPLETFQYVDGQLNGDYKKYFDSGGKIQQEASYKNGQLDGTMRYYNKEGQVTLEYEYKNGEKVGGGIIGTSQK